MFLALETHSKNVELKRVYAVDRRCNSHSSVRNARLGWDWLDQTNKCHCVTRVPLAFCAFMQANATCNFQHPRTSGFPHGFDRADQKLHADAYGRAGYGMGNLICG